MNEPRPFILLTALDGNMVLLNTQHLLSVYPEGHGTRIRYGANHKLLVKETPEAIASQLLPASQAEALTPRRRS